MNVNDMTNEERLSAAVQLRGAFHGSEDGVND